MTQKSLKASLDYTITPALGPLASHKDLCSLIIQNSYVTKTHSDISNFFKNCGQVDFRLTGFRLEKVWKKLSLASTA